MARRVVIDGGTGFRLLGENLLEEAFSCHFHLLLTHGHWDHLLGIPFFTPIYQEDTEILVDGWPPAFQAMTRVFDSHMGDGFFPVAFDHLKARIDYLNRLAHGPLELDGACIDAIRLNHPQGGLGFRFREGDHYHGLHHRQRIGGGPGAARCRNLSNLSGAATC